MAADLSILVVMSSTPVAFVTSRELTIDISSQCFIKGMRKDTFSGILVLIPAYTVQRELVSSCGQIPVSLSSEPQDIPPVSSRDFDWSREQLADPNVAHVKI